VRGKDEASILSSKTVERHTVGGPPFVKGVLLFLGFGTKGGGGEKGRGKGGGVGKQLKISSFFAKSGQKGRRSYQSHSVEKR